MTRRVLKTMKNKAIVVLNWDLSVNRFLTAITAKGPPVPNNPCNSPPKNKNNLWDDLVSIISLSKNKDFKENISRNRAKTLSNILLER